MTISNHCCTCCSAGENEDIRERIAAGLGAFAQHCSVEEVRQMLAGPVAAPSGQPAARMGSALIIANTAQLAPQRQEPACVIKLYFTFVLHMFLC